MTRMCVLTTMVMCGTLAASTARASEERAWLGCRIGPVPQPLDLHLRLNGEGVIVLNVAKDSPADKAGLERHDVIAKFGPEAVKSPDDLIACVDKHKAGDKVAVELVRKGATTKVEVVLQARPKGDAWEFKYERLPDALLDDRVGIRGRILRRGPDGWHLEDLGELDEVPYFLEEVMPKYRFKQRKYWFKDDDKPIAKFQARVSRDGKVIAIQGNEDGSITVERSDEKGDSMVKRVYKSPEELETGDPEAHGIYVEATGKDRKRRHRVLPRHAPMRKDAADRYRKWLRGLYDRVPDDARELFDEQLIERLERQGKNLTQRLEKQVEVYKERIADLEKRMEAWTQKLQDPGNVDDNVATKPGIPKQATTRFEVAPDGKITAHVRQGDAEVTLEFKNADELKAKRPDLYEKYEPLTKTR